MANLLRIIPAPETTGFVRNVFRPGSLGHRIEHELRCKHAFLARAIRAGELDTPLASVRHPDLLRVHTAIILRTAFDSDFRALYERCTAARRFLRNRRV